MSTETLNPNLQNWLRETSGTIELTGEVENDKPYIEAIIGPSGSIPDIDIRFRIDTGADVTLIARPDGQRIGFNLDKSKMKSLTWLGDRDALKCFIVNADIWFRGARYTREFFGLPFFSKFKEEKPGLVKINTPIFVADLESALPPTLGLDVLSRFYDFHFDPQSRTVLLRSAKNPRGLYQTFGLTIE